jgi:hypothetical protein
MKETASREDSNLRGGMPSSAGSQDHKKRLAVSLARRAGRGFQTSMARRREFSELTHE